MTSPEREAPSVWSTLYWPEPSARSRWLWASLAVCALAGLGSVIAYRAEPSTADWAAEMALKIHAALDDDHTVALAPPAPPRPPAPEPPPAPTPPLPRAPSPPRARAASPSSSTRASAPGPVAAQALAGASQVPEPLDFTSMGFVAGSAHQPVSGAVAAGAPAGREGARGAGQGPEGLGEAGGPRSLARAVTLAESAWDCPWPASADEHERDDAIVELAVQVGPDGHASAVRVLRDPGLGFGDAARACALRTQFEPARAPDGAPTTAWSPPIRVSFRR